MSRGDRFYDTLKRIDAGHAAAWRWPVLVAPLRLASTAAYRGLELLLGRRHPHQRVVARARELALDEAPRSRGAARRRVLVFTVRGWFVHASTDAILAKALERRGADVTVFLCGGGVPQCDFKPATDPHVVKPLCWRCSGFPTRLTEALGLPVETLSDLVSPGSRAEAGARVAGASRAELESLTWRGLPLYRLCLPSLQRSLLRGDPGDGPFAEGVLRGFLASALVYAEACEALLERHRPDAVVLSNGLFFAERILLERALSRGIRVVSTERGWLPGTLFLDRDQPAVRFDTAKYWDAFREQPLSGSEERRLDAYLAERMGGRGGVEHLWPRIERAAGLGLDPERPLVLAFSNILWDTAIFERDAGFRGMFHWIEETVRLAARHSRIQLVLRVHPAEVRLPMAASRDRVMDRIARAFPTLPPNVRIVGPEEGVSSYDLMRAARAVLVYTSTAGLEAALLGRPVLVAGAPHYRGRGFTVDVDGPAGYEAALLAALRADATAPAERELARRYANLLFFHLMQPFPYVVDQPRGARRLELSSLSDLDPGHDPILDRICDAILEGAPLLEAP